MQRTFLAILALLMSGCAAIHEKTLDNGLRVIVKEDHRSPVMVSQIWYKVGSIDEPEGLTGISHALEHMMFKGTARLKPNEFSQLIAEQGGRENAFTSYDYTAYYQQLEKSRMSISFELEADRMQNLALSAEEFAKEIQVVMEERRLRTEDQPDAVLGEKFMSVTYEKHSYRNPIIGWMSDLERMKVEDLRRWYARYYAPNNATLVVVGDVKPSEIFALSEKYFGPVPRRAVSAPAIPPEPAQTQERRTRVAAPAELPHIILGYHVPVLTRDNEWEPYALAVAAGVLDGGNAARLSREVVRERRIAATVNVDYTPIARGANLFVLEGTPSQGRRIQELEQAFRAQIARLREELVSEQELRRIKAQVVAQDVYERDSMYYQAMQLGRLATIGLDLSLMEDYSKHLQNVTAEQVRAVVRKYLLDTNLTVSVLDPLPIKAGQKSVPSGGAHVH